MKNIFGILSLAVCMLIAAPTATAQKSDKELKKELTAKVDKDSKKEAKALAKAGWKTMPGKLPLEKQIMASKYAALEEDENGDKLYFIGSNQATGGNYSTAKQMADSRARLEIARTINVYIIEKVNESASTGDYGDRDIETISEFVSANASLTEANLQGVTPVLEIYREGPKNTVDVQVIMKVNAPETLKRVKRAYRTELEKKSTKLGEDIEAILPF